MDGMMGTAADYIGCRSDGMPHRQSFTRLRRLLIPDPYNPDSPIASGWDQAETSTVYGALASRTSMEEPDPVRAEAVSTAELILDDSAADVQRGDRIKAPDGRLWDVQGYPHADVSPFTGWQPTLVCDLQEVTG